MLELFVDPHPLLDLGAFTCAFPAPLGELPAPEWLRALGAAPVPADAAERPPLSTDPAVQSAVRDLLRHGGYKPTGRGKPSAEYLLRAAGEGSFPAINAAVDACNVVSLHSGLPISLVDLDLATPPLRVGIAPPGSSYLFNPAGQEIRLDGLLCLHDAQGPCANGVKDAQRTKTHAGTRRALSLVWGPRALSGRTAETVRWYRALLGRLGGVCEDVTLSPEA